MAAQIHQLHVNPVVHEGVDLEDASTQIFPIGEDLLAQGIACDRKQVLQVYAARCQPLSRHHALVAIHATHIVKIPPRSLRMYA
jgi:hypothetical protein